MLIVSGVAFFSEADLCKMQMYIYIDIYILLKSPIGIPFHPSKFAL